ncbi:MAG: hypothetical protein K6F06_01425 [Bacteroidales bacterium]|nr:hypothetical protein [Bacteroidales bacterium]
MNTEMIINRTTLNGAQWQIVKDFLGVALFLKNYNKEGYHFSGYCFKSIEEANAHLDAINERTKHPEQFTPCTDCSGFYGRGSNVYYGD